MRKLGLSRENPYSFSADPVHQKCGKLHRRERMSEDWLGKSLRGRHKLTAGISGPPGMFGCFIKEAGMGGGWAEMLLN